MTRVAIAGTFFAAGLLCLAGPAMADEPDGETGTDTGASTAPQDNPEASERERRVGGHSKTAFVKTYDTNGDGQVSIGEFMMAREASYAKTDMDGDGSLTSKEYVGEFTERMDASELTFAVEDRQRQIDAAEFRFGFMDTDENGIMTAAEFHESGMRMFKRLDTNEDGFVNESDTADSF
ncbi:hypothetical protein [Erythrobacter sp. HL-111]|uniref:hypothetical protein n=1 Tax=Erythrobacter sp. HL-111 TaxID=1798193 RepID=UPI0006D9CCB3|nr:hypothetical protein [Erythrobacter sp. HL-111]KPP92931.1 MAG: EF hand [Erythrobacteraceae bacterium HL-111]SDT02326.1 EF hand [Erythrobacter sp. HL-111]